MPKYHSVETIPARIFFEILKSKDLQQLRPKPSESTEELQRIFMAIYDEYFIRSENKSAKEYLDLCNEITFLTFKIDTIKRVTHFLYYTTTTKEIREELLKSLEKNCGIYVDYDADFTDEVLRILQIEIGYIENDLDFAKGNLEDLQKESNKKIFDYYDSLVAISSTYPYGKTLDEKMTLAMYIAEEKAARNRAKPKPKMAA